MSVWILFFEKHNSLLSRFIKLLMYAERDEMVGNLQQIILLSVRLNSLRSPQRSSGENKTARPPIFFDGTDFEIVMDVNWVGIYFAL